MTSVVGHGFLSTLLGMIANETLKVLSHYHFDCFGLLMKPK
jgi:hypothetical protein